MMHPLRSLRAPAADPLRQSLREEVLSGLRCLPRTLPPKLFYDARGARLFEHICELDEYYPTRSELEILETHAHDIAEIAGPRAAFIEYGSGAGVKIRLLLDAAMDPAAYIPLDISHDQLERVAAELRAEYPDIEVKPVAADYTSRVQLPYVRGACRNVAFFPGSTIGNFHPAEATVFLSRIRQTIGPAGALVLGVDRRKDPAMIEAAYNDASGVTAAFNLNVLRRINRDLDEDFDLHRFRHLAFFNDAASRIEMHIESLADQTVTIDGETLHFREGETIWTESSY
jgi:dimethylhistidine N-methyltransferase